MAELGLFSSMMVPLELPARPTLSVVSRLHVAGARARPPWWRSRRCRWDDRPPPLLLNEDAPTAGCSTRRSSVRRGVYTPTAESCAGGCSRVHLRTDEQPHGLCRRLKRDAATPSYAFTTSRGREYASVSHAPPPHHADPHGAGSDLRDTAHAASAALGAVLRRRISAEACQRAADDGAALEEWAAARRGHHLPVVILRSARADGWEAAVIVRCDGRHAYGWRWNSLEEGASAIFRRPRGVSLPWWRRVVVAEEEGRAVGSIPIEVAEQFLCVISPYHLASASWLSTCMNRAYTLKRPTESSMG